MSRLSLDAMKSQIVCLGETVTVMRRRVGEVFGLEVGYRCEA